MNYKQIDIMESVCYSQLCCSFSFITVTHHGLTAIKCRDCCVSERNMLSIRVNKKFTLRASAGLHDDVEDQ